MPNWAPGTKARLSVANVSFDPANPGKVVHAGLGFQVVLPDGSPGPMRGWTLGGTDSVIPEPYLDQVQALADLLVQQMLVGEGLDGLA